MFATTQRATSTLLTTALKNQLFTTQQRNATKKAGGTVNNKADSAGRRLGIKAFGGERVWNQNILVRQRGLKWRPGLNVYHGKDHTLHAKIDGFVHFFSIPIPGRIRGRYKTFVNVLPTRERDENALVTFAAQIKKRALDSLEYRAGQREFMRQMRVQHGPFIGRDEFIQDKGKERVLSRIHHA